MKYKIKNYQQNDIHLPTTREKYPYMTKVAPKCTGMTVFIQLKKFSSWVNRNSLLINKDYPEKLKKNKRTDIRFHLFPRYNKHK